MLIVCVLFLVVFLSVLACVGLGMSYFRSKQKQQIRSMLRRAEEMPVEQQPSELLRPVQSETTLTKMLRRFQFMERVELILEQSGKNWSCSKLVTLSCFSCGAGFLLGLKVPLLSPPVSAGIFAVVGGVTPLLMVLRKRAKSMRAFEEQFPEALDFLSRSMRAGHGFSVAMEMLATDAPDPLGSAFRRVSNDLQLGSSLEVAFGKLLILMPLVDVRFFVSSVILQQETGGNLGEILSKLAFIIRERFRVKGQVKAASAHGRITGIVLVLMPVAVTGFMMITTPEYLRGLVADSTGRMMVYGAVIGQMVGYFVIRKITNIKI
jgi:tight adherence protein B